MSVRFIIMILNNLCVFNDAKKAKIDYNSKRVFTDIVKQLVRGYYDFR